MGMRKVKFENGYYYHIYNRGVEKRIIYLDEEDRERFIYYLYELNSTENVGDIAFKFRKNDKIKKFGSPASEKKLVEIICFCLMSNHFHLLLKQIRNNGVALFIQKLATAYAKYFNEKYQRIGSLFQGRFKAKLVDKNEYLNYMFYYILANPLEIIEPKWKESGIKNIKKAKKFLESYKWSSYKDFVGQSTHPFVVNKNSVLELFETQKEFEKFIDDFVNYISITDFQKLTLE